MVKYNLHESWILLHKLQWMANANGDCCKEYVALHLNSVDLVGLLLVECNLTSDTDLWGYKPLFSQRLMPPTT